MHVLDMIEPRKQILQNEVISTKQLSHIAMMTLSVTGFYPKFKNPSGLVLM